ncbi:MAG: Holliday junction resolvase RecU [Bacillus sp. (in: Bacteria)]|jgi:recombination protein U|nr:Holliday junction resolvase RecU [Bacillus sp. (in: firmicutes)]
MEFHYPNGRKYGRPSSSSHFKNEAMKKHSYSNRGMTLEEDLNVTNEYYREQGIAIIHKKPTPVQIVQVHYPKRSAAVITEAYFKQPSTTDYNGVYKGKYIDFEAKETQSETSFPLRNFHEHQISHIEQVLKHGGISFVIIRFKSSDELYLLEGCHLLSFWARMVDGGRKSISKKELNEKGHLIPLKLAPRIDYLRIVDELYFS